MFTRAPLAKQAAPAKGAAVPAKQAPDYSSNEKAPETGNPKCSYSVASPRLFSGAGDGTPPSEKLSWQSAPLPIQAKLEVGAVDDPLEAEADRMSDAVLRAPFPSTVSPNTSHTSPAAQRKCSCGGTCDQCRNEEDHKSEKLQMKPSGTANVKRTAVPAGVHEVLRSPGRPLDRETRAFFEPRFGYDFSRVKIHSDASAVQSVRQLQARAYVVGNDIVFGAGEFDLRQSAGRTLLAHELTHVVQQDGAKPSAIAASIPGAIRATRTGTPTLARQPKKKEDEAAAIKRRQHTIDHFGALSDADLRSEYKRRKQYINTAWWKQHFDAKTLDEVVQDRFPDEAPRDWLPDPIGLGLPKDPRLRSEDADVEADRTRQRNEKQEALNSSARRLAVMRAQSQPYFDHPDRPTLIKLKLRFEGYRRKIARMGLVWNADTEELELSPAYVAAINEVIKNDEAKEIYEHTEWDLEQQPEEKGVFGKTMNFLCENTNPCKSNMEQFHADLESGMSRDDALARGVVRTGMLAVPGGPEDLQVVGERPSIPALEPTGGVEMPSAPPPEPPAPTKTQEPPVPPNKSPAADQPKPVITAHADADGVVLNEVKAPDAEKMRNTAPAAKPDTPAPPNKTANPASPRGQRRIVKVQPKPGTKPKAAQPPTTPSPTRRRGGLQPDNVSAQPKDSPSTHDADVLDQPGIRKQDSAYPSAHQHHVFPQELRAWFTKQFEAVNESIDEYTVYLSEGEHQAVHKRGQGANVKGKQEPDLKGWNQEWKDFRAANENATPQQIFEEAGRLMDKYKISDADIARYGSKK